MKNKIRPSILTEQQARPLKNQFPAFETSKILCMDEAESESKWDLISEKLPKTYSSFIEILQYCTVLYFSL